MLKLLDWLSEKVLSVLVGILFIFIPLYPKLPLWDVAHTWVYIRIEDILVALALVLWLWSLFRRKTKLPDKISEPVIFYWLIGFFSTFIAIVFIFPSLANVFPNVAVFHYLRRIEYLGLLFVAFSTIKKPLDLNKYLIVFAVSVVGVILYGFGQKFLGLPAFLTMNEEFAKGVPLSLPPGARITSTFAGHYDLAAFLVFSIAILGGLALGAKNLIIKILLLLLSILSLIVLLFTASRVSFTVYLFTISLMLILQKKKWLIIPVIIFSLFLASQVSGTAERFAKTLRIQPIVINTQTGQPIAVLEKLPPEISGIRPTPTPFEQLPLGTGFIGFPPVSEQPPEATTTALIRKSVSTSLKLASISSEISTISGSFLIQKAFVYDISFTTRFQGEWPRAWSAFARNPLFGTGYSSISLATDNDYLRLLGETGILGFLSFLFIFLSLFIYISKKIKMIDNPLHKSFILGVTAGISGLFLNAVLIDVFEASKVAFILWLFCGLAIGVASLYKARDFSLLTESKKILTSRIALFIYLFLLAIFIYQKIFTIYFTGDDFVWLKWAATARFSDLLAYFYSASGFFYRPLPKILYFITYAIFWFKPLGYHLVSIILYFTASCLVFVLANKFFQNLFLSFILAVFFLFLPINTESVIWVSSYSGLLMTVLVLFSLVSFLKFKEGQKIWLIPTIVFFLLGLLSHEAGVILPILLIWIDLFNKDFTFAKTSKLFYGLLFLLLMIYGLVRFLADAHGLSGDYSYNIVNLPFNVVGNLIGYISTILLGLPIIPYYDFLRITLRENKTIAMGLITLFVVIIAVIIKYFGKGWIVIRNNRLLLFSGLVVISLLPYLGLGNLSERYGLLASVFVVLAMGEILTRVVKSKIILMIVLIPVLIWYEGQINSSITNWQKAGEISRKIIYSLKDNYRFFPKKSTIIFVNIPIRLERSWVFPVGLSEALWFVYRDETMKVVRVNSVEEAVSMGRNIESKVFVWEKEELKEVSYK